MNAKSKLLLTAALGSIVLLSVGAAQAAPTRDELNEALEIQILHEAGYSFPSIEETLKARKAAARAKAEHTTKAQEPVARAEPEKTSVRSY